MPFLEKNNFDIKKISIRVHVKNSHLLTWRKPKKFTKIKKAKNNLSIHPRNLPAKL
jgi:hypothetical protein